MAVASTELVAALKSRTNNRGCFTGTDIGGSVAAGVAVLTSPLCIPAIEAFAERPVFSVEVAPRARVVHGSPVHMRGSARTTTRSGRRQ